MHWTSFVAELLGDLVDMNITYFHMHEQNAMITISSRYQMLI